MLLNSLRLHTKTLKKVFSVFILEYEDSKLSNELLNYGISKEAYALMNDRYKSADNKNEFDWRKNISGLNVLGDLNADYAATAIDLVESHQRLRGDKT